MTSEPLWIPGPTHVRPAILAELAVLPIGHRSRAMVELLDRIDGPLRRAFGLAEPSTAQVAVATCSATAMMEGALLGTGPRILCLVNGAFSRRWCEVARTLGKQTDPLEVPWGEAPDPDRVAEALARKGPYDAVTLVLNETSTGVRTPLEPLAEALAAHAPTQLLVDGVSALGGFPVDFDRHGLDFAFAGTNKALALPPGLTVLCASERYLAAARQRHRPSWYLDPVRLLDAHAERRPPTTPAVGLVRALARQLEDIEAGGGTPGDGWRARYERHERMGAQTLAWAAGHGIEPFPSAALSSPTVSCLSGAGLDVQRLLAEARSRGFEVGGGYGPLKTKTFRIGHMGDHTETGLESLLDALDPSVEAARLHA